MANLKYFITKDKEYLKVHETLNGESNSAYTMLLSDVSNIVISKLEFETRSTKTSYEPNQGTRVIAGVDDVTKQPFYEWKNSRSMTKAAKRAANESGINSTKLGKGSKESKLFRGGKFKSNPSNWSGKKRLVKKREEKRLLTNKNED